MKKQYDIFYNDGVYYGSITFKDKTQSEIEEKIKTEIANNNRNPNPLYHIARENFKEVVQ